MGKDEWLTPPWILARLGQFDLDPCAPIVRPWPTARHHFTIDDNGLAREWHGRVWMNPPFGTKAQHWMARMAGHGDGIAMIPARTETAMFFNSVWPHADAVLFMRGRPTYHHVDGSPAPWDCGAPMCLIAYGLLNAAALAASGLGHLVPNLGRIPRSELKPGLELAL
jgi:hypothetical protein